MMTYQLPVDLDNCAAQQGIGTGSFLRVDRLAAFISIVIITKETKFLQFVASLKFSFHTLITYLSEISAKSPGKISSPKSPYCKTLVD